MTPASVSPHTCGPYCATTNGHATLIYRPSDEAASVEDLWEMRDELADLYAVPNRIEGFLAAREAPPIEGQTPWIMIWN